jgi:hypothetical protein
VDGLQEETTTHGGWDLIDEIVVRYVQRNKIDQSTNFKWQAAVELVV